MRQFDGVNDAVVKGFVNDKGQTWLCGYYTGRSKFKRVMNFADATVDRANAANRAKQFFNNQS